MVMRKLIFLVLFIIFYTITHAQYVGWMMGTWKSTSVATLPGSVTNTIQIDDVSDESFTGTKTSESNDRSHAKIIISISGSFRGRGLYIENGDVLHKEDPKNGQWYDCSSCTHVNKMIISHDSLILINSISGCDKRCDGEISFYRLLSEYDSSTQQHLVDRFGRPSDIIGFHPYHPQKDETAPPTDSAEAIRKEEKKHQDSLDNVARIKQQQADDAALLLAQQKQRQQEITDSLNLVKQQRIKDSLDNVARIKQQQIDDAALLAQQKKRQQEITDSLNLVKQQRIKDSLDNVARIKQQQIDDAALLAQQKKRDKQITDSLNLVKQQRIKDSLDNVARIKQQQIDEAALLLAQQKKRDKQIADSLNLVKQQRIKDSLDNVARIRQQQIADSTLLAQQKKRDKQIADSLNLVKQKEQQRIKDSLDNVARLEKIRLRTEDSLRDVQAKKRQQEIADSISLAKQKEHQRIKDSLDNVARIRQQQINDSTLLAQQKKRDKQIADSLNLVKQKEQQHIKDSLDNVAKLEQIRRRNEDSLRNVQIKKRQQEVADSLNLVNAKKQQYIKDSLQSVAAANLQKQRTTDSLRDVQARKRQQEISDSLAAVRKQQYNDSLQKAALAKAATPAADKPLTSRTSVLLGTYHITSPDILIELFDNGEIDGDRVSVYHNNEIIVSNQVLGLKAITLNIHADTTNREHEFVMVAENLGTIPPNSALMRVTVGKQIYKLTVNTDMKTNARIVFYYDGK